MARRIGADMLANLDRQLTAGAISPAQHEARKAEVLELIRTGKDVDMGWGERAGRTAYGVAVIIVGILAGIGCMLGLPIALGFPVGVVFIVAAIILGRRVMHPRIR